MTTYRYVDNSGADGDGSIGTPWNNIAGHVNDMPADSIMYVRGDAGSARIYTEAEINPTVSGSSGNLITLRPYQDELVCIKNSSGTGFTMNLDGAYWVLYDLEIDHNESYSYGILMDNSYILIYECTIHNLHNHNIVIGNDVTDTVIRDNTVYDIDRSATSQDAHGIMVQLRADRTIVKDNIIHDCSGDCIQFHDPGWAVMTDSAEDCEVTGNHFYRGAVTRNETAVAVKCSKNLLIANNHCHGFNHPASSAGIVITKDQHDGTVTIRDNIIHDARRGFRFANGLNPTSVACYNNLVYDIDEIVVQVISASNINIYNNTFADSPGALGLRVSTSWVGGSLQNNLWYDCDHLTKDGAATFSGVTVNHNGRWDTTSDAEFVDAGTDTTGSGDPGFVNAAGDDYRLVSTSLAVDAGVDVGLDYYGDAPDLGYWEYEPIVPPIAVLREPGASLYKLRLKTAAGALIAEIVAFEELCYTKRVNSPGLCTFRLDGDHTAIDQLEHRSQVEVWRANPDLQLDWHCDSYNLYLSPDRFQSERNIFTTICPGQMWFLSTRYIAWYAATADRTAFTSEPVETIMKTLVSYNACAAATTGNGRLRNGAITGLSIQADGTRGNSIDWNCAYKNLLLELRDLAQVAGGDFDLIKTAAQAWEFRWYTGQRGNDRRGAIVFARERGNMINPRYLHDRMNEKTVAIVGGQGEKDQRDIVIRTGDDYSASNDVEVFVDARNRTVTAGYNAAGDKRLSELRAREAFSFEVVQTPSCFYGEVASGGDYELGDLTTGRAFGIEKEHKIVGVTVTVIPAAEYCEAIDIEIETPVTAP